MNMSVSFKESRTVEEDSFVKSCINNPKFTKYIGTDLDVKTCKIVEAEGEKLGVVMFNLYCPGTTIYHAEPNLFLSHPSPQTFKIFIKLLQILFEEYKVENIIIKVYSNNKLMMNLTKNFGLEYCGTLYNVIKNDVHVHFFAITRDNV